MRDQFPRIGALYDGGVRELGKTLESAVAASHGGTFFNESH